MVSNNDLFGIGAPKPPKKRLPKLKTKPRIILKRDIRKRLSRASKVVTRSGRSQQQRRFRAGARRLAASVDIVESPKGRVKRGRAGRPRGTFKYSIPGKGPVDVFTWRKYMRRVRALNRLRAQASQGRTQQPMELEMEEVEMEPRVEQRIPVRRLPVQQEVVEQDDNILHAPNVFKNELTGVGQRSSVLNVDNVKKPITNPQGDYFTDVDPFTGNHILRRRPRERWAS